VCIDFATGHLQLHWLGETTQRSRQTSNDSGYEEGCTDEIVSESHVIVVLYFIALHRISVI
jgi:hypothetical protein